MKNFFINKKAFTLIELLVVISIIGLLSSLSVYAINIARVKARDAKRKSDIRQIVQALYLHADSQGGEFFNDSNIGRCLGVSGGASCWLGYPSGSNALNAAVEPYLKNIPLDPLSNNRTKGNAYIYASPSSTVKYHCSATSVNGPFLIWLPDNLSTPYNDSQCLGLGYYACCGSALDCSEGYYCAYKIEY
jgi:prepilin-type N-terminal cleavage/methylation domain-containing protein